MLLQVGEFIRLLLDPVPSYENMAELEECMASGDPQRTWFPEMIQKLRLEWHESMTIPDLIALCDALDSMLHEIRSTRNIRSPIVKCPKCGKVEFFLPEVG